MNHKSLCALMSLLVLVPGIGSSGSERKSTDLKFALAISKDEAVILEIRSVPLRYLTPVAITPESFHEYWTRSARFRDFSGSDLQRSLVKLFEQHEIHPTTDTLSMRWNMRIQDESGQTLAEIFCDQGGSFIIENEKSYKFDGSLGRLLRAEFKGML